MKHHVVLLCLLLFSAAAEPTTNPSDSDNQSDIQTGNAFLAHCETPGNDSGLAPDGQFITGMCRGYLMGIHDAIAVRGGLRTCASKEVRYWQFDRVAVKFMHDHPEELHKPTPVLAAESWMKAFPCPAKK
jgi:Ssp1 endopeptidase immunity protein Rap1a